MRPATAWACAALLASWAGPPASAQTPGQAAPAARPQPPREAGRPRSFAFSASVLWFAPSSLGTRDATLTGNNASGSPYTWFRAEGDTESAAGVEARVSCRLTRRLAIEGGATFSRPGVTYSISNDVEKAGRFTAPGETMSQMVLDASLIVFVSRQGFSGGRLMPFVQAGGGFLRQWHGQESALADYWARDSGQVFHVGGGARYALRRMKSGAATGLDLRLDARYYVGKGGFTFDGGPTSTFAAGGGLVVLF